MAVGINFANSEETRCKTQRHGPGTSDANHMQNTDVMCADHCGGHSFCKQWGNQMQTKQLRHGRGTSDANHMQHTDEMCADHCGGYPFCKQWRNPMQQQLKHGRGTSDANHMQHTDEMFATAGGEFGHKSQPPRGSALGKQVLSGALVDLVCSASKAEVSETQCNGIASAPSWQWARPFVLSLVFAGGRTFLTVSSGQHIIGTTLDVVGTSVGPLRSSPEDGLLRTQVSTASMASSSKAKSIFKTVGCQQLQKKARGMRQNDTRERKWDKSRQREPINMGCCIFNSGNQRTTLQAIIDNKGASDIPKSEHSDRQSGIITHRGGFCASSLFSSTMLCVFCCDDT